MTPSFPTWTIGERWCPAARRARRSGDDAAAERHLKRGLAELPDDPELQLELRHLKK